jgi:hypothetical protein
MYSYQLFYMNKNSFCTWFFHMSKTKKVFVPSRMVYILFRQYDNKRCFQSESKVVCTYNLRLHLNSKMLIYYYNIKYNNSNNVSEKLKIFSILFLFLTSISDHPYSSGGKKRISLLLACFNVFTVSKHRR